ncbi:MAG: dTMP kinase [Bellilinea sp.]
MFITLEGPEGSGKTSQMAPLADFLRQLGNSVVTLREPGGSDIGEQIRGVIMELNNTAMNPRTEILLFLASRAQFVEEIVRPTLNAGQWVLCDRYADSTLAYQGYGHQVDLDILRRLLDFATGGLIPDLTLLLDIETNTGLSRKRKAGGEWNRLDAYPPEFHQRVRQGYLELARQEPQRWVVIDASQPLEMVQSAMRQAILARVQA